MPDHDNDELTRDELRAKLNLETGRLGWPELQRHFARGVVIVAARELDLVEVAATFAENDTLRTEQWIATGRIRRASDADARNWHASDATLWAVVARPWVIVQEAD
jgi:hypothetical protein